MTMEFNRCETCGAGDGRAGVLVKTSESPRECLNCHDTRKTGNITIHTCLARTNEERKLTVDIICDKPAKHLVKMNECEGGCVDRGGHVGDCELVHVFGEDGRDWGKFSYCETARQLDENRGMTVELADVCETCDGSGIVSELSKWSVDTGTKWQRNFEEEINVECLDCNGNGYSR